VSALELKNVRKIYRSGDEEVVALDHANLTVGDDELIALVGPSGSGKSTLISISGGLLTPTEGAVVVGDEDISHYSPKRLTRFRNEQVGFVFQTVNLVPFLTARENLTVVAELTGAHYDAHTRWPEGFDPIRAGCILRDMPFHRPARRGLGRWLPGLTGTR
jgi:putative ABC transport system ATP-binding protein